MYCTEIPECTEYTGEEVNHAPTKEHRPQCKLGRRHARVTARHRPIDCDQEFCLSGSGWDGCGLEFCRSRYHPLVSIYPHHHPIRYFTHSTTVPISHYGVVSIPSRANTRASNQIKPPPALEPELLTKPPFRCRVGPEPPSSAELRWEGRSGQVML